MEIVYFTLAGIVLYFGADWILNRIEQARGERLKNRSVVFFAIILVMALVLFQAINYFVPKPTPTAPRSESPPTAPGGEAQPR